MNEDRRKQIAATLRQALGVASVCASNLSEHGAEVDISLFWQDQIGGTNLVVYTADIEIINRTKL